MACYKRDLSVSAYSDYHRKSQVLPTDGSNSTYHSEQLQKEQTSNSMEFCVPKLGTLTSPHTDGLYFGSPTEITSKLNVSQS